MEPMRFNGMNVYASPYALETTNEPAKRHTNRRWMSGRVYHERIQKKWLKRFGKVQKPCAFKTPLGFFVHPSLMPELRRMIASEYL